MKFEYDDNKSQANLEKHGIDFVKAQGLWLDDAFVSFPAKNDQEERWIVIGKIEEKHWSAIVTYRGDAVRIISVRRSRTQEVSFYESK
jgi:hypothetical protein